MKGVFLNKCGNGNKLTPSFIVELIEYFKVVFIRFMIVILYAGSFTSSLLKRMSFVGGLTF
jgi:hypothetical protein